MSNTPTRIQSRLSHPPTNSMDSVRSDAETEAALGLDVFASLASMRCETEPKRRATTQGDGEDGDDISDDETTDGNKRLEHNYCERRRRENIKSGFQNLQASMTNSNVKLSKMEILRSGIMCIKKLTSEIQLLEEEVKRLRANKASKQMAV